MLDFYRFEDYYLNSSEAELSSYKRFVMDLYSFVDIKVHPMNEHFKSNKKIYNFRIKKYEQDLTSRSYGDMYTFYNEYFYSFIQFYRFYDEKNEPIFRTSNLQEIVRDVCDIKIIEERNIRSSMFSWGKFLQISIEIENTFPNRNHLMNLLAGYINFLKIMESYRSL